MSEVYERIYRLRSEDALIKMVATGGESVAGKVTTDVAKVLPRLLLGFGRGNHAPSLELKIFDNLREGVGG